jgi:hypothetical protein
MCFSQFVNHYAICFFSLFTDKKVTGWQKCICDRQLYTEKWACFIEGVFSSSIAVLLHR